MNSKIYKYLFFFNFILIFFPLLVIYIVKGTHGNIRLYLLISFILYALLFLFNFKKIIKKIKILLRLKIIKIYLLYLLFISITTIFNMIAGHYHEKTSFYAVRMYPTLAGMCLIYFIPTVGYFLNIKFKTLIRLFYFFICIIFVSNIIQYLSFIFNISLISVFLDMFMNARNGLYSDNIMAPKIGNRVYAFFSEPSELGQFIFIIMPFIFSIKHTKDKLYNNKYLNFMIKESLLPLMLVVLVLTKSPIYLVFCLSEFIILSVIYNIKFIKRYIIYILLIIISIGAVFLFLYCKYTSVIEQTYIMRIIRTIQSFGSFTQLVFLEPSLATRIYNYHIQFVAFTKNILVGCGFGNSEVCVNSFYLKDSILIPTMENLEKQYYLKPYSTGLNKSVVWTSLAEFGALGFLIYCYFVYYNIKIAHKLSKYSLGIYRAFLTGIEHSIYALCIISFYNLGLDCVYLWLIFGMLLFGILLYTNKGGF